MITIEEVLKGNVAVLKSGDRILMWDGESEEWVVCNATEDEQEHKVLARTPFECAAVAVLVS